ncbi:MAG: DNA repair protein RecO C-terminal domain-containing protein [Holosporales bacterium]|jgi:recombinational DNA repair protein (RecF pathway)|nr:DNA repair protein RecO C-terminal domain-containing protein [Holosporales bacterium]
MISWSGNGVIVQIAKKLEKYSTVDIFTEHHGLIRSICNTGVRAVGLSRVVVEWKGRNDGDMGFWHIQDLRHNFVTNTVESESQSFIGQRICFLLSRVLPYGVSYPELFTYVANMSEILFKSPYLIALNLYAYFEFLLLKSAGFGFDVKVCSVCGHPAKIEYISSNTGGGIGPKCRLTTKERIIQVPKAWYYWEEFDLRTVPREMIRSSLSVSSYFMKKYLLTDSKPTTSSVTRESHPVQVTNLIRCCLR